MALICPQCGTDNRDTAKFCKKCAAQLVQLWPETTNEDPPSEAAASERRRRRRAAQATGSRPTAMPWLVLIAALVVAGGVSWMWSTRSAAPVAATVPAPVPAPAATVAAPPVEVATTASAPTTDSAAILRAVEELKQRDAQAEAAARASAREPPAAQAPPPSKTAPAQRRPAQPRETPTPPPQVAVVPEPPPEARPVEVARPAPPRELCAGTTFIDRAICLQRECGQTGMRQHPQCVQMREQQETFRRGTGGG